MPLKVRPRTGVPLMAVPHLQVFHVDVEQVVAAVTRLNTTAECMAVWRNTPAMLMS